MKTSFSLVKLALYTSIVFNATLLAKDKTNASSKEDTFCERKFVGHVINSKGVKSVHLVNAPIETPSIMVPPHMQAEIHFGDFVQANLKGQDRLQNTVTFFRNGLDMYGILRTDNFHRHYIETLINGRNYEIRVSNGKRSSKKAPVGEYVKFKLDHKRSNEQHLYGKYSEVLGEKFPEELEEELILQQFGQRLYHSTRAVNQAEELLREKNLLRKTIKRELKNGQKDLRKIPLRSIDPSTTTDIDDLIYTKKNEDGTFKLYVAIADPTHWFDDSSPLAREVYDRHATAYYPKKRFPLFPLKIEQELFSLHPGEERLAMVGEMDFDQNGILVKKDFYEAVVINHRKWNYDEVDQILEDGSNIEFTDDLELYALIHQNHKNDGALYLNRKLREMNIEEVPSHLSPELFTSESHELIAEFMISANKAAGSWMKEMGYTGVYRSQLELNEEDIKEILKKGESLGYEKEKDYEEYQHSDLQSFLSQITNPDHFAIMVPNILKRFRPAYYTDRPRVHSTLNIETYAHFTSPIRRAPDLVNHRIMKALMKNETPPSLEKIESLANHFTAKTILETRRELFYEKVQKLKKFKERVYRKEGEKHFPAKVIDMNKFVIVFKVIGEDIDGIIYTKDLVKKYGYEFSSDGKILESTRLKKFLTVGSEIMVKPSTIIPHLDRIDFRFIPK